MPTKPKGTTYLLKDRFQIYVPGMTGIAECRFPPDIIRDMDLVNQEKFANLIKLFITNAKIPPGNIIIVISDNASFIKDFTQPPEPAAKPGQPAKPLATLIPLEELEKQAKEFTNLVPFEEVLGKTIPLKNGFRVYAANKELLDALQRALEANKFEVSAILPAITFGPEVNTKPVMDSTVANIILHKSDSLIRDYNLINQPGLNLELENEPEKEMTEETGVLEKPKSTLPLLLGAFGFLMIVLIIVAWTQLRPQPKPAITNPPGVPSQTPVRLTVTPMPGTGTTLIPSPIITTTLDNAAITVKIISTTQVTEKATGLKLALEKLGIKNIDFTIQQNIAASESTITFSKNVSQSLRPLIISEVQKVASSTTIQEKPDTTTNITILLVN